MRLEIIDLHKSYATKVLNGVDLKMGAGEIHGLVGENGAGKSTLFNVLCGLTSFDAGEILINGEIYCPATPGDAFEAGVSLCAQELSLIETLSVAENISLRALPGRWRLDKRSLKEATNGVLEELELDIGPDTLVADLSLSQRQIVEIAKALVWESQVHVLDEPTSALTESEAEALHRCLKLRASRGTSILYSSHRLEDVLNVCDHVWVLRDGRMVRNGSSEELTVAELIRHMSGSDHEVTQVDSSRVAGEVHLSAELITTAQLPHPVTLHCREGEIVGLAGLMGAGKTEVLNALYGLEPLTAGAVTLKRGGQEQILGDVQKANAAGVGLVPENRATHGIFHGLSVAFNTVIADLGQLANHVLLSRKNEDQAVHQLIDRLQVKCDGPQQSIDALSGGNQQKLMLARWLHNQCSLFLLDEPTRGVDVGSKLAIHELLQSLKTQGAAIVIASSELEELISLCDRILVLSRREIAAEFERGAFDKDSMLAAAFSSYTQDQVI